MFLSAILGGNDIKKFDTAQYDQDNGAKIVTGRHANATGSAGTKAIYRSRLQSEKSGRAVNRHDSFCCQTNGVSPSGKAPGLIPACGSNPATPAIF